MKDFGHVPKQITHRTRPPSLSVPIFLNLSSSALFRHGCFRLSFVDGSNLPYPQNPSLLCSPSTTSPSQAALFLSSLSNDCLCSYPPHLLPRSIRHCLRCHRRASRHRIHSGQINWIRPPRCFPSWSG